MVLARTNAVPVGEVENDIYEQILEVESTGFSHRYSVRVKDNFYLFSSQQWERWTKDKEDHWKKKFRNEDGIQMLVSFGSYMSDI